MCSLPTYSRKILQTPSILHTTHRFFLSKPTNQNPNPENPIPDEPTSAYFDNLITTAGRSKDFTTLHHLLNKRFRYGFFNTTNTFRFISEFNDELTLTLDHLTQTLTTLDQGFGRKNAFDLLIARLCKLNRIEESIQVINTMLQSGVGVNAVTFHPLLNVLTRKRNMEVTDRLLALMREMGISPDITSYNYVLTAYAVDGDLPAAAAVVSKIGEDGLKADPRTFDAMVLGACRVGKVEGALKVLRRMEEERVPVLYSTHGHVIRGLLGLGCFEQAVGFVLSFGGRDKGLDTENFGYLGKCLIRLKRFEEAKFVLGEMDKRGLVMGEKLRQDYTKLPSSSSS